LIEDCAETCGATYKNKKIGNWSDISCFSFEEKNFPLTGLTLLGFITCVDPPRPSVPLAINVCNSAGIKVIMVTGENLYTANSFAK
jgi:cation transport ATPase